MPLIYFHVNFISQRSCLLKKKTMHELTYTSILIASLRLAPQKLQCGLYTCTVNLIRLLHVKCLKL